MIGLIARMKIQEGKMDQAVAAFKDLVAQVATEKGTLLYTLNTDPKVPDTLVVVERYQDKAALDFHSSTGYFKAFGAQAAGFLAARPEITFLTEITSI